MNSVLSTIGGGGKIKIGFSTNHISIPFFAKKCNSMSVPHHLRTSGIIMLSLLGTASILSLLVAATSFLTVQSIQASDLLPAADTLFFAHKPTAELLDAYTELFPELSAIQFEANTEAVALTSSGYALFIRETQEENTHSISIPPFAIVVSDPAIKKMLQPEQDILSTYPAFQQLQNAQSLQTPWVYIQQKALPSHWDFLNNTSIESMSVRTEEAMHIVNLAGSVPSASTAIPKQVPVVLPQPFLVISGNSLATQWDNIQSLLSTDSANINNGILLRTIKNLYGDSVSWQYDIAPLLDAQATIEMEYNASGTLLYAIHGTAPLGHSVEDTLQKITTSFARTFPDTIEIRSRTLDNRFNARDIRMNENPSGYESVEVHGWTAQRIPASPIHPTFITAARGKSFIISNADSVWNTLQTNTPQKKMQLPTTKNIQQLETHMGGFADVQHLTTVLQKQVPELQNIVRTMLVGINEDRFTWSLGTRGLLRTLQIHRQEEGEFPWQILDAAVE